MSVLRGLRDMGAHLISLKQDHSELELCLLQLGTLGTGFDSRQEIYGTRAGLANALAAEQRRLLLLLDWPTLPEFIQVKNAPRSR